jgi:uncharacterized protein YukE
MAQYCVTPSVLTKAANLCTTTSENIQSHIQQVQSFIDELFASGYMGPCASQLGILKADWGTDATNLTRLLPEIASNLMKSAGNYGGSETENTSNLIRAGSTLLPGNF